MLKINVKVNQLTLKIISQGLYLSNFNGHREVTLQIHKTYDSSYVVTKRLFYLYFLQLILDRLSLQFTLSGIHSKCQTTR